MMTAVTIMKALPPRAIPQKPGAISTMFSPPMSIPILVRSIPSWGGKEGRYTVHGLVCSMLEPSVCNVYGNLVYPNSKLYKLTNISLGLSSNLHPEQPRNLGLSTSSFIATFRSSTIKKKSSNATKPRNLGLTSIVTYKSVTNVHSNL